MAGIQLPMHPALSPDQQDRVLAALDVVLREG
jgi:dTDP-4-amino-4,6-dideoxygalactose transaminase